MKKIFVLLGYIKYEGENLLGVYSTKAKAEKAFKEYKDSDGIYQGKIQERFLNDKAETRFFD